MEFKDNLLLKFWIKHNAEEYAIIILEYLYSNKYMIDDYENFLKGFNMNLFNLDEIGKYLFYKNGEVFLYQFYLYFLGMPDAQYFRTQQHIQAAEKAGISSTEKGETDSK